MMSPTNRETGRKNFEITVQLGNWVHHDGTGIGFDSSTGFSLPNGAERAPDASWVTRERWFALTEAQRQKFAPLCPDFVLELRSPIETLSELMEKLEEFVACGARLGWLVDPIEHRVHVYEPGKAPRVLDRPERVSGDPVLRGFELDLAAIW